MCCYAAGAPALLYLALFALRNRRVAAGLFYLSISLLFCWYLFDLTLISAGINEREIRWIATPLTVMAALSAVWMAVSAARVCYRIKELKERKGNGNVGNLAAGMD